MGWAARVVYSQFFRRSFRLRALEVGLIRHAGEAADGREIGKGRRWQWPKDACMGSNLDDTITESDHHTAVPCARERSSGWPPGGWGSSGALEHLGSEGTVILGVPAWLYERLLGFMESRGLRSVAEFVIYVLSTRNLGALGTEGAQYADEELRLIRGLLRSRS